MYIAFSSLLVPSFSSFICFQFCLAIFIHILWVIDVFQRAIVWFIFIDRYLFLTSLDIYFLSISFKLNLGIRRRPYDSVESRYTRR